MATFNENTEAIKATTVPTCQGNFQQARAAMFCYCLLFLFEFLALRAVISYFICITHHASHHPTFHRRLLGVGGSKLYCLLQFVLRMLAVSLPACFRFEIYTVWTCRLWPFFRSTLFMLSVPISSHTHTHLIYVIALCSEHILTPERNRGKRKLLQRML